WSHRGAVPEPGRLRSECPRYLWRVGAQYLPGTGLFQYGPRAAQGLPAYGKAEIPVPLRVLQRVQQRQSGESHGDGHKQQFHEDHQRQRSPDFAVCPQVRVLVRTPTLLFLCALASGTLVGQSIQVERSDGSQLTIDNYSE